MDKLIGSLHQIPGKAYDALSACGHNLKRIFFRPSMAMKTFYALFLIGIACYAYTWVTHAFTVPLGGDYTLQEMTFLFNGYDDWHHFFQTGSFVTWDTSLFLGVDNVGANSFYYLFDPFFLILLIFPRDWLLTLQGLEFVPKMVLAGMFFYWYLGSFKLSPKNRMIGALVYGFSGWSFVYLWFHFIDSAAFFPLILLGIERVIQKRDPRILLVGFLLNGMTNYFFFVVFIIGGFLYAIFRFLQTMKSRTSESNWAVLGMGIFAFVIGICLSAFTLLPGMVVATGMPRTNSNTWLTNIQSASGLWAKLKAVFDFNSIGAYHQATPLVNFLFMTDGCFYSNLINVNGFDNLASSMYVTTPLLLIFFAGIIEALRNKRISYLLGMAFTLLLVFSPIGFYLFSGFTVAYARYFIVPMTWIIVFDCITLEKRRDIPRSYLDISLVITLLLQVVSSFLVIYYENSGNPYWDTKMIEIPLSMAWVFVCYFVMRPLFHKKQFSKALFILSAIDVIIMANVTITFQGTVNLGDIAGGQSNIAEETKIVSLLKEDESDSQLYRIFNPTADRNNINISLEEGYNGLGAFHSVYAYEAQDFLVRSRVPYARPDDWSMGIHNRRENLETFLGTKYYLVPKVVNGDAMGSREYDIPYGYVNVRNLTTAQQTALGITYSQSFLDYLASDGCTKDLYVNTDFVDFAFPFDTVINTRWLNTSLNYTGSSDYYYIWNRYEDINEYPLLRYAMLDDADYKTFKDDSLFNAGTITLNGVTTNMNYTTDAGNASAFVNALVTRSETGTAPISYVGGSSRLNVKVYSAQWPATAANPSGEYQEWTDDYRNDSAKQQAWRDTHSFELMNGISEGDLGFNYDTLLDDNGVRKNEYSNSVLYNSKFVLTPTDSSGKATTVCTSADPSNPTTGCYVSLRNTTGVDYLTNTSYNESGNANIEWRLFDSAGKLISKATPSYDSYKTAHGYYTDRPVAKIVGIIKQGSKDSPVILSRPSLYVQQDSDYQAAIDSLRKEPVMITKRNDHLVDFSTNYTTAKFVVLNIPDSSGYTLRQKATNSDGSTVYSTVTTYKTQGGFIGFSAAKGAKDYELVYTSPYLLPGCALTAMGIVVMLFCLAYFSYRNRFDHAFKENETLKTGLEKRIEELQYRHDDCEDN
jgi:uncharacterized membrane protein YfhO